jgi:hypothetical protein
MNETQYHQIQLSIDERLIGKSDNPISIKIKDKCFIEFSTSSILNLTKYFQNKDEFYKLIPENLECEMYQKNKIPIDFMLCMPTCLTLYFVISEKVKKILESLNVKSTEYITKEIKINGYFEKYYLMFIPLLESKKFVDFKKTIFRDSDSGEEIVFRNYDHFLENISKPKKLYVKKDLLNYDIINLQVAKPYFSKRIIEIFQKENVIGFEIIKQGSFKVDLNFT